MEVLIILAATVVVGIGSVWIAAGLLRLGARGSHARGARHLLSLAAGALLATAFMHLLPEAFEADLDPRVLFTVLLAGLVVFFLLDKAELWHHGHEHHDVSESAAKDERSSSAAADAAPHSHGHAPHAHVDDLGAHHHAHPHGHVHGRGGWAVLTGDGLHCFGDGVLIASAFMADLRLGMVAALAVLAHEVPHHIGDLVVLRQSSEDSRAALMKVSLAGTMTALGGLVGWWLVERLQELLPYLLVLASSSFIYVALADLIPQLQRRLSARDTALQVLWLVVGIAMVTVMSRLAHPEHEYEQDHESHHEHAGARGDLRMPVLLVAAPRGPG